MSLKTVAVVIISDQILQGSDEYSIPCFLLKELSQIKYHVRKISVLEANIKIVVNEIQQLSKQYDIVLVIEKPENKSVAYKALSDTFYSEHNINPELEKILKQGKSSYYNNQIMQLPSATRILFKESISPVIYLQRIFLLKDFHLSDQYSILLKNHLINYRKEKYCRKFIEFKASSDIKLLENLCDNKTSNITVHFDTILENPVLKIAAEELEVLNNLVDEVTKEHFKEILNMYVPPLDVSLLEHDIVVKQAMKDILKSFEMYGPENIFIAFNGGKDCTVLLHLMNSVLRMHYPSFSSQILCLYVQSEDPFPEQEIFLRQTQKYFGLEIRTVQSAIKEALAGILAQNRNLKACLMGTRRTDPFSENLNVFQMTDADWPQVMRVNPLLDWHHSDIWDYLLYFKVFYCKLYDMGYTSLGSQTNTTKNPSLLYYDIFEEKEIYLPAYKLLNEFKERNGRVK